jgi:ATP-binding protein involved in chromosome partitioning
MFKIAVMSGKGGVGKSTISTQIALCLNGRGKKVGLVDLDVEGPNIARMLGIMDKKIEADKKVVKPLIYNDGIKVVSISSHPCIVGNNPVVWKGKAHREYIRQVIEDVDWGNLDYMVLDFPPGTGDAVIGLINVTKIDGLILVSAPSKLSTDNCEMVIKASNQLGIPILGMIENMSCFQCECTRKYYIFGESNAKELANKYGIKFYGEIPILPEIAKSFDEGRPYVYPLIHEVVDDIIDKDKGVSLITTLIDKVKSCFGGVGNGD